MLATLGAAAVPLLAQTLPDVTSDLYYLSLRACLQAEAQRNKKPVSASSDTVVINDQRLTRFFPSLIDTLRIEYLDYEGLKRRYSRLKVQFPAIGLEPIRNEGKLLIVRCTSYRIGVRSRKLILGVVDGWDISWQYDTATDKFAIADVKRWWLQM